MFKNHLIVEHPQRADRANTNQQPAKRGFGWFLEQFWGGREPSAGIFLSVGPSNPSKVK
jgi:hypothetical protein